MANTIEEKNCSLLFCMLRWLNVINKVFYTLSVRRLVCVEYGWQLAHTVTACTTIYSHNDMTDWF